MLNKSNVLVVDDDPDKRNLLAVALEMAGYQVRTANDGEAGLASVESHMPDLIITDVMMPKMDGYELARRVRANPQTRFIPIIIQSAARNSAEDQRRGAEVGALGYITDPTDLDLLLMRVGTLLDFKSYLDTVEKYAAIGKQTLLREHADQSNIDSVTDSQRKSEIITSITNNEKREFDVFLCHNSEDKERIKEIGSLLIKQEIKPWLDEWVLRPGLPWQDELERQIGQIKAAAVFVGGNGVGPWQQRELKAFLNEFVSRACPVIPVLLPDVIEKPDLPIFLKGMTWVDFRKQEPDPIEQLIWGVTGNRR